MGKIVGRQVVGQEFLLHGGRENVPQHQALPDNRLIFRRHGGEAGFPLIGGQAHERGKIPAQFGGLQAEFAVIRGQGQIFLHLGQQTGANRRGTVGQQAGAFRRGGRQQLTERGDR